MITYHIDEAAGVVRFVDDEIEESRRASDYYAPGLWVFSDPYIYEAHQITVRDLAPWDVPKDQAFAAAWLASRAELVRRGLVQ